MYKIEYVGGNIKRGWGYSSAQFCLACTKSWVLSLYLHKPHEVAKVYKILAFRKWRFEENKFKVIMSLRQELAT